MDHNVEHIREKLLSFYQDKDLNKSVNSKKDKAGIAAYENLNNQFTMVKTQVQETLMVVNMLENLSVMAQKIADQRKKKDKNKQEELKQHEMMQKIQKALMNEIDVPDEFVQLLQVANTGGIEALEKVANWAKNTAKEIRNDEAFNKQIEKMQDYKNRKDALAKSLLNSDNYESDEDLFHRIQKKIFRTNQSEETYREMLITLDRSRGLNKES
jgi:hypothetical protein